MKEITKQQRKAKITVFSPLVSLSKTYSVANVVINQCETLVRHGYQVDLIATKQLPLDASIDGVNIIRILKSYSPRKVWRNDRAFNIEVQETVNLLFSYLKETQVCISHDVTFLQFYMPFNLALRLLSVRLKHVKWLNWLHSRPIGFDANGPAEFKKFSALHVKVYTTQFNNSKIIYLNHQDVDDVAKYYHTDTCNIKIVYNPINIYDFLCVSQEAQLIAESVDYTRKDILMIYPARVSSIKQFHKLITLVAYLKINGISAAAVLCHSYNTKRTNVDMIDYCKALMKAYKLDSNDIAILRDLGFPFGVPQRVVRDLFLLSNVFVFPSRTEAAPLVVLEASLGKNLLILNDELESLKEFANDEAYYVDFNQADGIWAQVILQVLQKELESNKLMRQHLNIVRNFNSDRLFKEMVEPLFYSEYSN